MCVSQHSKWHTTYYILQYVCITAALKICSVVYSMHAVCTQLGHTTSVIKSLCEFRPSCVTDAAFGLPRKSGVGAGSDVTPELSTFQLQSLNNRLQLFATGTAIFHWQPGGGEILPLSHSLFPLQQAFQLKFPTQNSEISTSQYNSNAAWLLTGKKREMLKLYAHICLKFSF